MNRRIAAALSLAAALFPSLAFADGEVRVSEADYAKYRKIRYAQTLASKRTFFDRKNEKKYEAEADKTLKESGWSKDHLSEIETALQGPAGLLQQAKEDGTSAADLKESLEGNDPVTVATVRAHLAEIVQNDDDAKAEEQVKRERDEAKAGSLATEAMLQGVWIPDVDASVRALAGNLGDEALAKMKQSMGPAMEGNSYEFRGNNVIATAMQNGKPTVVKGTYRLDGHKAWFKDERGKERSMDVGFQGPNLQLGMGFASILYKKK